MTPRKVIIDCDTGVDDAQATLFALRSPLVDVLGITTTAGNVPLDKVVRNTLVVVEHSGKQVPVYQGSYRALLGAGGTAEYVHGKDGLGDIGFPDPTIQKQPEHAVDFLVRSFLTSSEPIELITLGPLTNIALAIQKERDFDLAVRSITMMAGGIRNGNTTAAAEFNVWADPEAADIVFRSRIAKKTMVALDPNYDSGGIYAEDVAQIEAAKSPWCWMAGRLMRQGLERWQEFTGEERPTIPPDLTAMGVALDPTLVNSGEMLHVVVETAGIHTRGMTVVDRRPHRGVFRPSPEPNVFVVYTLDNPRYRKLVVDTFLA